MNYKRDDLWYSRLADLTQFITLNKRLPSTTHNNEHEASLRNWVNVAKLRYKNGKLDPNRLAGLYEIIPQEFGGNIEDSLIYKLLRENDIYSFACITHPKDKQNIRIIDDKQLIELLNMKVKSENELIGLIHNKILKTTENNSLADKVLNILGLSINRNGLVISNGNSSLSKEYLLSIINKRLYGIDISNLRLYIAVFNGNLQENKHILYTFDKYIDSMIKTLSEKEEKTIRLRYYEHMKTASVGAELGVGGQRIKQIEEKAIQKLRHTTRSGILKGNGTHRLFTLIIKQEDLKRALVMDKYSDQIDKIEEIANSIRNKYKKAYSTSFILGATYTGLLDRNIKLPEIKRRITNIINSDKKYMQAYIDIFKQGESLLRVDKELSDKFKNRLLSYTDTKIMPDTLLIKAGFSARATNALMRTELNTVGDILAWVDNQEDNAELFGTDSNSIKVKALYYITKNIRNIGELTANEIADKLYN